MAASVILNEQLMKSYAIVLFALMLMNLVFKFTNLCIILCIIKNINKKIDTFLF